jgi:hypothetical protein
MRRAATASSVHVLTLPTHHGRSHSRREAAVQRLEPFADGRRTHVERHQADIRFGSRRHCERQQCEGQLTATPGMPSLAMSDRSRPARWTRTDPEPTSAALISPP